MSKVPSLTLWVAGSDPAGKVRVDIELSDPWSSEAVEATEERIAAFVETGKLGGYPAAGVSPALSRLDALGPSVLGGNVLSVLLGVSSVDRRAFQFLRHMVAGFDFGGVEPRHIQVREASGQGVLTRTAMPLVTYDNEGSAYPQPRPPPSCGFQVAWPDTDPSKFRVVLVEFAGALTHANFTELALPVEAWGALVEANAFSLPEAFPDEVECIAGQTVMFDRHTAQIEVPRFIGSEAAWDTLLCLLDAFSEQGKQIAKVTIE